MQLRTIFRQFMTYAGVGSVGTVAHYLLLLLLVGGWGVAPYLGAVAGFALGGLVNYYLNHRFTFRSRNRHQDSLPKFLAVAVIGMMVTGSVIAMATERLHIHYFIAQLFTSALLLFLTFLGNRIWTFRTAMGTAPT